MHMRILGCTVLLLLLQYLNEPCRAKLTSQFLKLTVCTVQNIIPLTIETSKYICSAWVIS